MQRVLEVDVLRCPHCGGPRKVLDLLTDPAVLFAHLGSHLELPAEPPLIAAARGPPEPALPFE